MSSGLTYTFAAGPGEMSKMAVNLLESIEQNTEAVADDIIIYVVTKEKEDIPVERLKRMNESATVVEGPMPNQEYPVSAFQGALQKASEITDNEYLLGLDADTVVLDDIRIHEREDAELFLCPEAISTRYWSNLNESYDDWKRLYADQGIDFPPELIQTTVDQQLMIPYYNSGVILTKNTDFPDRLVELCNRLYGELPASNYFAEMVALALLARQYDLTILDDRYNYFQPVYTACPPDDTKVVHYNDLGNYQRVLRSPHVRQAVSNTVLTDEVTQYSELYRRYQVLVNRYRVYARRTRPDVPPYRSPGKCLSKTLEFAFGETVSDRVMQSIKAVVRSR